MGIFKKHLSGAMESSNELNAFLGAGTEYRGRLDFTGTVRIDGNFHGEISSSGSLVLGKDAVIKGQVRVGTLISNGKIHGDVEADSKAILQKNSVLDGSLRTPALVVEEGASIEGTVEMSRPEPIQVVRTVSAGELETEPEVEEAEGEGEGEDSDDSETEKAAG